MARVPTEIVNEIRSKARIEEVIGHYIDVIKKGNSYKAYCPFHDDHNPSLSINVDKQIFKCWSCPAEEGSAGDVFKFVMKYKHIDYYEAIKEVANLIGYKYDFGVSQHVEFQESPLHKVMKESINFTQYTLNTQSGKQYKDYLLNRHITEQQIQKFCIGYNPLDDKLHEYLTKKGFSDADMIKANVVRLTENGVRDVFYDRITIPIFDSDCHPIGFTARSIDPNNEAKYVNTAETELFKKSNVVFNLNNAKESIREKKFAIIAEGPMDVMAFDRAGFKNAICSMGTATTVQQLKEIKRFTMNLLLAYDGDKAGQGAILRTGKLAIENGFHVVVINNSSKLDPDEIVNQYGANELVAMISKPKIWMDFIFEYYQSIYDLNNYEAKKEYANVVGEQISKLHDDFDKQNFLQKLSQITGFSTTILQNNKIVELQTNSKEDHEIQIPIHTNFNTGFELAQRQIIIQLIASKAAIQYYKDNLGRLPQEYYNNIANTIIDYASTQDIVQPKDFIGTLEPMAASIVFEIYDDPTLREEYDADLLKDAIIKLKIVQLENEANDIRKEMNQKKDPIVQAKYGNWITEKNKAIIELRKQLTKKSRRS